jgi:flagellar basal-body rod protein FlgG
MIRGWYTGASGMATQQVRLDTVANNLANIDTDGYKRDVSVHKAFAQLLLRRMDDDGVYLHPLGSGDMAPIIGKLGTGVESNELFTQFEQGALKGTDSDFDLAMDGKGFMSVSTPQGERYTRNGSFILGKEGYLETKEGFPVMGENGPIQVKANNFQVDKAGRVWINETYAGNPEDLVGREDNAWERTVLLDTLKIVDFESTRYLAKQGSSLWKETPLSGPAEILEGQDRPTVLQGFTEASNVNPILEMVRMIEVNRAYEANQKTIQSQDASLGKLINEVAKV